MPGSEFLCRWERSARAARAAFCALTILSCRAAFAQDAGPTPPATAQSRAGEQDAPLPTPGEAVAPAGLTLEAIENLALANNPSLGEALAKVRAARGRQLQSGFVPNPLAGYDAQNIGEAGTAGQQGGYVAQQWVTGGKLRLNRAIGGREVQEKRYLVDAQELKVLTDVRVKFYQTLVAQQQVQLTRELLEVSTQLAESSKRLLAGQQISRSDLLLAEIEVQESKIQSGSAVNTLAESQRQLAAVAGVDAIGPEPLTGNLEADIPTFEWEPLLSEVLSQNPELSAAWARVQMARVTVDRARRENIPNVNLAGSVAHMNQTGDDMASVQAILPLPIWNQNQGNISAAIGDLVAAENRLRRMELDVQEQLAAAFRRYATARLQVERYGQDIVPRAAESLELVRVGYREGQVDFLSLLTSQRTFIRVNLAYLAALGELRQACAVIEGRLLEGSLQGE